MNMYTWYSTLNSTCANLASMKSSISFDRLTFFFSPYTFFQIYNKSVTANINCFKIPVYKPPIFCFAKYLNQLRILTEFSSIQYNYACVWMCKNRKSLHSTETVELGIHILKYLCSTNTTWIQGNKCTNVHNLECSKIPFPVKMCILYWLPESKWRKEIKKKKEEKNMYKGLVIKWWFFLT